MDNRLTAEQHEIIRSLQRLAKSVESDVEEFIQIITRLDYQDVRRGPLNGMKTSLAETMTEVIDDYSSRT